MEAVNRAFRVGLTGGIASGKTTAAQLFAALGVPVIDADEAARAVVEPGTPGLAQVVKRFGAGILDTNGRLDRHTLRNEIFRDAAARNDLETILHPLIREHMERESMKTRGPYQIFAIPLLVEGGKSVRIDRILVVDTDETLQLQRLLARDAGSPEQAHAIMASQASRSARLAAADDVLDNRNGVAELRQSVEKLHHRYLELAAARHNRGLP